MRKKLKELLHKEEGFTLVELLAVIVILGIIVAIAIPTIGNVTKNAKSTATQAEQDLVVDAAQMYVLDYDVTTNETVSVTKLSTLGYLEDADSENIKNGGVDIEVKTIPDSERVNYNYEWNPSVPQED